MEAVPTPPATAPTRTAHDCWLEAGGGTAAYDADRYLALMRDAGILRERAGLTEVVKRALATAADATFTSDDPLAEHAELVARALTKELADEGFRIHDVARCVRPAGDPLALGRPMTPEEEATLLPAASAPAGARPRSSGPTFEHVTPEGDRFLVPEGWTPGEKSSRCRSCSALILWATTPNAKRAPVNPDGTSHFSDCPDAPAWRKRDQ